MSKWIFPMPRQSFNEPSAVTTKEGNVWLEGPDGVDVVMTPQAAIETSDRLLDAGTRLIGEEVAERQRAAEREGRFGH